MFVLILIYLCNVWGLIVFVSLVYVIYLGWYWLVVLVMAVLVIIFGVVFVFLFLNKWL